jgi:hypothetical protein
VPRSIPTTFPMDSHLLEWMKFGLRASSAGPLP